MSLTGEWTTDQDGRLLLHWTSSDPEAEELLDLQEELARMAA